MGRSIAHADERTDMVLAFVGSVEGSVAVMAVEEACLERPVAGELPRGGEAAADIDGVAGADELVVDIVVAVVLMGSVADASPQEIGHLPAAAAPEGSLEGSIDADDVAQMGVVVDHLCLAPCGVGGAAHGDAVVEVELGTEAQRGIAVVAGKGVAVGRQGVTVDLEADGEGLAVAQPLALVGIGGDLPGGAGMQGVAYMAQGVAAGGCLHSGNEEKEKKKPPPTPPSSKSYTAHKLHRF